MPDHLTPAQRHNCMSHIRSRNTKPEVRLRKALHALGYRYRINVRRLPGTPDIVLPKNRTCIFVNGCFWHGHQGCPKFVMPRTHTDFWEEKIHRNRERDLRDAAFLESLGWNVITVWECELTRDKLSATVNSIADQLVVNRNAYLHDQQDRRDRRTAWQQELRARKERYAILSEPSLPPEE